MRVAVAFCLLAAPVAAQDRPATFSLPAGCDAYVTVHGASCTVDHHFICANDPAGHQRRVSLDSQGMTYAGMIDDETQWVESFHALSGHSEQLAPDPSDPASLSELIETGVDTFDFRTLSEGVGTTRFVGSDTLTGRQVTIDDVTLDETAYQITAYDSLGNEIWQSAGNEFISRDWRMFLSGTGTTTNARGSFDKDNVPVEFIFPGEPGFLSARPKHGCGVAISSADFLKEPANDNL